MKVLAFDTSTKYLSVACLEDEEVKSLYHEDVGIRHSEILTSTIKGMLEEAGWKARDIDLVCTGLGPGSFTGLRIGVATVKGLSAVLGNKVIGVPTMDAMVMNVSPRDKKIAPFLDAHKGKVYTCIYEFSGSGFRRETGYLLTKADDFLKGLEGEIFVFGNGITKYKEELDSSPLVEYSLDIDWYPKAVDIGRLGIERACSGFDSADTIDPMYMHSKYCSVTEPKLKSD
jgi:tRNA threonylcarbamoyladenosine biosynthesis protein TsaB